MAQNQTQADEIAEKISHHRDVRDSTTNLESCDVAVLVFPGTEIEPIAEQYGLDVVNRREVDPYVRHGLDVPSDA